MQDRPGQARLRLSPLWLPGFQKIWGEDFERYEPFTIASAVAELAEPGGSRFLVAAAAQAAVSAPGPRPRRA